PCRATCPAMRAESPPTYRLVAGGESTRRNGGNGCACRQAHPAPRLDSYFSDSACASGHLLAGGFLRGRVILLQCFRFFGGSLEHGSKPSRPDREQRCQEVEHHRHAI